VFACSGRRRIKQVNMAEKQKVAAKTDLKAKKSDIL
jgi:hypothetical protein